MIKNKQPGVNFIPKRGKWIAQIKINGKNKFIGYFHKEEDAIKARLKFEKENKSEVFKFTKEKERLKEIIKNLYNSGTSIKNIAAKLNKDYTTIHEHIENMNLEIKNRKYELIDENFLSKIDQNWKAYFLGLFYADGNMGKIKKTLTITLKEEDSIVLEKLSKLIFSKIFNLRNIKSHTFRDKKTKKFYTNKISKAIDIHSKKIYSDLLSIGCTPNKSLTIKFPNETILNQDHLPSFIRGYFDGDGCINKNKSITICCSKDFGIELQKILYNTYKVSSSLSLKGKIYILSIGKISDSKKFYELIYSDNLDLFIERKKKRFDFFFQNKPNKFENLPKY